MTYIQIYKYTPTHKAVKTLIICQFLLVKKYPEVYFCKSLNIFKVLLIDDNLLQGNRCVENITLIETMAPACNLIKKRDSGTDVFW